jgi:hypothetical protein
MGGRKGEVTSQEEQENRDPGNHGGSGGLRGSAAPASFRRRRAAPEHPGLGQTKLSRNPRVRASGSYIFTPPPLPGRPGRLTCRSGSGRSSGVASTARFAAAVPCRTAAPAVSRFGRLAAVSSR